MAGQCWNAGCGEAASRFRGGGLAVGRRCAGCDDTWLLRGGV